MKDSIIHRFRRKVALVAGATVILVAAVALADSVYSAWGASDTSYAVDGNFDTTYATLYDFTSPWFWSCPAGWTKFTSGDYYCYKSIGGSTHKITGYIITDAGGAASHFDVSLGADNGSVITRCYYTSDATSGTWYYGGGWADDEGGPYDRVNLTGNRYILCGRDVNSDSGAQSLIYEIDAYFNP